MGSRMSCENFAMKAIEVTNLSKCYRLYEQPIDRLKQAFVGNKKKYYKEFRALHEINFSVERGETVVLLALTEVANQLSFKLFVALLKKHLETLELMVKWRPCLN